MTTHLLPAQDWEAGDLLMTASGPHRITTRRVEGVPGRVLVVLDDGTRLRVPLQAMGKIRRRL